MVHLWPSLLVLAVITGLILFAWYPHPFLQLGDIGKISALQIFAGSLIGPALTWLVYKKGKRELKIDLSVIVLIQVVAMAWGVNYLYQNRPYFMVFTVDRFEVLAKWEVDLAGVTDDRLLDKPLAGPILLYANMPKDAQDRQQLLREVMFEGKPDLQFRPEFWSLYADKKQAVPPASRPLDDLQRARPGSALDIDKLVRHNGGDIEQLKFAPAPLKNGQFAAIINAQSGELVDALIIDPWIDE